MKPDKKTKLKYMLCILCITLFSLAGYIFVSSPIDAPQEDTWANSGFLKVGHALVIQNTDNRLSLLDSKDVLSANGLYYAAWAMGEMEPYVNTEGETVDLYDAQLYLCLGEYKTDQEALKNMTKWLDAGKSNYDVLTEEEITCSGQSYCLITYHCISEGNPYDRGISAFGVYEHNAVCLELTCREDFDEDLRAILLHFLEQCAYSGS